MALTKCLNIKVKWKWEANKDHHCLSSFVLVNSAISIFALIPYDLQNSKNLFNSSPPNLFNCLIGAKLIVLTLLKIS